MRRNAPHMVVTKAVIIETLADYLGLEISIQPVRPKRKKRTNG